MKRHKKKLEPQLCISNATAGIEKPVSLVMWCFKPGRWTLCQWIAMLALLCFAMAILMNGAVDTGIAQLLAVCAYACMGVCGGMRIYRNLTADRRAQSQ